MYTSTDIYTNAPTLTYQYSDQGEVCSAAGANVDISVLRYPGDHIYAHQSEGYGIVVSSIDEIPSAYKAYMQTAYPNFAGSYERIQFLYRNILTNLSDNEYVIKDAWILGLHPDGGKQIQKLRERFAASKSKIEAEVSVCEKAENRAAELEALLCPQVKTWQEKHEEGTDYYGAVTVAGQTYRCHNISDVGYAIIGPRGGIPVKEQWYSYAGGTENYSSMTDAEKLVVEYIRLRPIIYTGVNM